MNFAFITRRLPSLRWRLRPSDPNGDLGPRGERLAERHLKSRRYRIVRRNYRCPVGEVDLVAAQDGTIVFVEVKTRSSDRSADPQEAARYTKWSRVERAARCFLTQHCRGDLPCRFDLVTVVWPDGAEPVIEHFEDVHQPRWT